MYIRTFSAVITSDKLGSFIFLFFARWFEVETNYDHWVPPPASDNRRDPAVKKMNEIGPKNITVDSLLSVMSLPPVLNHKTTYTIVMSAAKPELTKVWVRHYNG